MQIRNKTLWLVLLAALVVAGIGSLMGHAATNDIAYVDMQEVYERFITPLVNPTLQQDVQKLQAEFDSKAKGLDDNAKSQLFATYQARLEAREKELVNAQIEKVLNTAKQVAQESGFKVVLSKDVVLAGGTDVTAQVLTKLKSVK